MTSGLFRKTIGSGRDFGELKHLICLQGAGSPVLQPTLILTNGGTGLSLLGMGVCVYVQRSHTLSFCIKSSDFKRLTTVENFGAWYIPSKIHLCPGFCLH